MSACSKATDTNSPHQNGKSALPRGFLRWSGEHMALKRRRKLKYRCCSKWPRATRFYCLNTVIKIRLEKNCAGMSHSSKCTTSFESTYRRASHYKESNLFVSHHNTRCCVSRSTSVRHCMLHSGGHHHTHLFGRSPPGLSSCTVPSTGMPSVVCSLSIDRERELVGFMW